MKTTKKALKSLSGVFFAPSFENILIIYRALRSEVKSSFEIDDEHSATSHIIRKYYNEYCTNPEYAWCFDNSIRTERKVGSFNLQRMMECVRQSVGYFKMQEFFHSPSYFGMVEVAHENSAYDKTRVYAEGKVECSEKWANEVFAIGRLMEDTKTCDSDCYQTAGGSRSYVAKEGTTVYYCLNGDNTVYLRFKSDCVEDSYNNNICGVSTGGGKTTYAEGQRVEYRSINTNSVKVTEILKKYNCVIDVMDTNKGGELAERTINRCLAIINQEEEVIAE